MPLAPVDLCGELTRVIDAEALGFAPLRGSPIGPGRWAVEPVLASFADCRLEGGPGRFAASYVCESQPLADAHPARLDDPFERIAARISACLSKPTWYPREFREGDGLTLAGGEKMRTWADMSTSPAPYLQLKSEEDFESRAWRLRLLVHTMR